MLPVSSVVSSILSVVFVVSAIYFYLTTDFRTEKRGRYMTVTGFLIFPIYGVMGLIESIPGIGVARLFILNFAGVLIMYGFWQQYKEVQD